MSIRVLALAAGALLPAGALLAARFPLAGEDVTWLSSIDEAKRAAKETSRPMFLVFR